MTVRKLTLGVMRAQLQVNSLSMQMGKMMPHEPAFFAVNRAWRELGTALASLRQLAQDDQLTEQAGNNDAMPRSEFLDVLEERDDLKESVHYANGVADLAIKHRDDAETKLEQARAALELIAKSPHPGDQEQWLVSIAQDALDALSANTLPTTGVDTQRKRLSGG